MSNELTERREEDNAENPGQARPAAALTRGYVSARPRGVGEDLVGYLLLQWEKRQSSPWRFRATLWWRQHEQRARLALLMLITFLFGALLASTPDAELRALRMRQRLENAQQELAARQGELELARLELARLNGIVHFSATHDVPADLASSIYDIALQEGIEPKIAFALVSVESDFVRRAISSKGAVGLTQLMPSTALTLQPGIGARDLFEPRTNLRLGFRYLRLLLEQYHGDLRLALLAYNRGPTRVDELLRMGANPSNGYTALIRRESQEAGKPGSR